MKQTKKQDKMKKPKTLEEFKKKHGGLNPRELKIHQRAFLLGIVVITMIFNIAGVIFGFLVWNLLK